MMGRRADKGKVIIPEGKTSGLSQFNCERYKELLNSPYRFSNKCCNVMKKKPAHKYAKETGRHPMTGQMAEESRLRTQKWIQNGCNGFNMKQPISNPMSFWTENDVLAYIVKYDVPICSVYGNVVALDDAGYPYDAKMLDVLDFDIEYYKLTTTGCKRTGCMFCGFGAHCRGDERFVMMKETHPKQYEYIFKPWEQGGLAYKEVIDWLNENIDLNIKY